jgi:hypothetical protein
LLTFFLQLSFDSLNLFLGEFDSQIGHVFLVFFQEQCNRQYKAWHKANHILIAMKSSNNVQITDKDDGNSNCTWTVMDVHKDQAQSLYTSIVVWYGMLLLCRPLIRCLLCAFWHLGPKDSPKDAMRSQFWVVQMLDARPYCGVPRGLLFPWWGVVAAVDYADRQRQRHIALVSLLRSLSAPPNKEELTSNRPAIVSIDK